MKRILSVVLAFLMVFQAASFTVAAAEEKKVTITYTDKDGNVSTYEASVPVTINEEGKYVIDENVESNYTSAITAVSADGKTIQVEINGDIIGNLTAEGEGLEIAVNGSLEQSYAGITATDGAKVVVVCDSEGQVNGYYNAVFVDDATAEISGNISSEYGTGVNAAQDAVVVVDGNIEAYQNGIKAQTKVENNWETSERTYYDTKADVTVNGDITVTGDYGNGINAGSESNVTVVGDVTTKGTAIQVTDSADVKITGEVTSENGNGIVNNNSSRYDNETNVNVTCDTAAKVTVTGDVTAYQDGINATGESTITVTGDVNAGHNKEYTTSEGNTYTSIGGSGITGTENSVTTVNGDVTSVGTGITVKDDAKVTVAGDVVSDHGSGISNSKSYSYDREKEEYVYNDTAADVTVNGDLTAYNTGISATGESTITVDGDVKAGHMVEGTYSDGEKYSYASGYGVSGSENAVVTIDGSLTSVDTAIYVSDDAKVTVDGDVTSNHGAGISNSKSISYYDEEKEKYIYNDTAADVTVNGNLTAYNTGISATGESTITVNGDVKAGHTEEHEYSDGEKYISASGNGVSGSENAVITIDGNLTSANTGIIVKDDAKVTVDGDVTSTHGAGITNSKSSYYDREKGKTIYNDTAAVVTVNGDLTAYNTGISTTGESAITVNGNLSSTSTAIRVSDDAKVTVDGDVTSTHGAGITNSKSSYYDNEKRETIYNDTAAVVTVNGDLTAYNNGISATGESTITVDGDVKAGHMVEGTYSDGEKYSYASGYGVSGSENAVVTIDGSLTSVDTAIRVSDDAKVTVDGDVTSTHGAGITNSKSSYYDREKGKTIYNDTAAVVTVNGDLTAYDTGISATGESTITVNGDVNAGHKEKRTNYYGESYDYYNGQGITAYDSSKVSVNGNVTSAETGLTVYDDADVAVSGNVISEDGNGIDNKRSGHYDSETQSWIYNDTAAHITVGGDITAGDDGIQAQGGTEVQVKGKVSARYNGIEAGENAIISVGGDITNGHMEENYYYTTDENGNEIRVELDPYGTGTGISAYDSATVNVGGNVTSMGDGIIASSYTDSTRLEYSLEENESGSVETRVVREDKVFNESEITVGGNVTADNGTGVYATGNSKVIVGGDVTSKNGTGIIAASDNTSSYTYKETIIYDADGEYVDSTWKTISVTKDESIGSEVTVGGNVTAKYTGVYANNNSKVTVGGDVTSEESIGIEAEDRASVQVGGNVESKDDSAIIMGGDTTVTVEGDVSGGEPLDEEEAKEQLVNELAEKTYSDGVVEINMDQYTTDGGLIVKGTVSAEGDYVPLVINMNIGEDEKPALPENMPDIKVYELDPSEANGEFFEVDVRAVTEHTDEDGSTYTRTSYVELTDAEKTELREALAATIQYIIKVIEPENGSINLAGTIYDEENGLNLAHEGDSIAVTVSARKGYKINGIDGGKAEVIKNDDGSWTVIVKRGGGVTISANISKKQTIKRLTDEQMAAEEAGATFTEIDISGGAEVNGVTVKTGDKAMDVMMAAIRYLANRSGMMINIMGVNSLLNKTEQGVFNSLNLVEKMMITFTALGLDNLVEEYVAGNSVTLSQRAKNLRKLITERLAAMTEEEKAAYDETVNKNFGKEKAVIYGSEIELKTLELRVATLMQTEYTKYGFRETENGLELVKLSTAIAPPAK